jgi:acyl-CoA thioester hydrolase
MGHVNNAVIMEYFDLGKEKFFQEHGMPPEKADFTVMIVHFEVDFQSQIRFHDRIAVETEIEGIGNKSLKVLQRVVDTGDGRVCATCHTVMSGFRRSTGKSEVIPPEIRKILEK